MSIKPPEDDKKFSRNFKNKATRIKKPLKPDYPRNDRHYVNVKRNIVVIEESKLEICARDYEEGVKAAQTWHTPLGIFTTIILTMFTATFNSTTASNTAWIALGASGFWLFGAIKSAWSTRKKVKNAKSFVNSCKNFDDRNETTLK